MLQPKPVADGIWMLRTVLVNVFFVRVEGGWILVDAGIPGSAPAIRAAAASLFGDTPPLNIVLTHGHFDHVGAVRTLAEAWDVPVYAHLLELPYLSGRWAYPPPDPTVGGGLLAWSSFLYPRGPYDIGDRLLTLPPDGRVPDGPAWRTLHTPGHTPGHVALVRDADGVVIAGDAVTTTKQESAWAVAMQRRELHGPPAYYTSDWESARESVRTLAALRIETLLSGHGRPMHGEAMRRDLRGLAFAFDRRALPRHGRYVGAPVTEGGPPPRQSWAATVALLAGVGAGAAILIVRGNGRARAGARLR